MTNFEFLKSQLRPPTDGLHDAFTGELALAERRGEWVRALNDAFKESIDRDFRGGIAQRQQDLQRELTAFEEQGRTGRAAMSEAGEERRSIRYNDLQREQEDRRRAETQAEQGNLRRKEERLQAVQEALGALMGGQGVPQPQPPQAVMGAPMPEQGAMLGEAALMSKLDPSTALNYQAFRTQQKELEAREKEKKQANTTKLADIWLGNIREAQRLQREDEREQQRFEHEKELQDRAARLKEPTPRDIAIGRWKDLGLKPDPGDLLNGIPPERPEAFQARMEAWIDREEARARTEKGGDSSSRPAAVTGTGTTPPASTGPRSAQTPEAAKAARDIGTLRGIGMGDPDDGEASGRQEAKLRAAQRALAMLADDKDAEAEKAMREAGFDSWEDVEAFLGGGR